MNDGNLKPFKAGQSGNPAGGPKGSRNRASLLQEFLDVVIEGESLDGIPGRLSVEKAMVQSLIKKALSGNLAAFKEIQNTVYGKITDKSEVVYASAIIVDNIG